MIKISAFHLLLIMINMMNAGGSLMYNQWDWVIFSVSVSCLLILLSIWGPKHTLARRTYDELMSDYEVALDHVNQLLMSERELIVQQAQLAHHIVTLEAQNKKMQKCPACTEEFKPKLD